MLKYLIYIFCFVQSCIVCLYVSLFFFYWQQFVVTLCFFLLFIYFIYFFILFFFCREKCLECLQERRPWPVALTPWLRPRTTTRTSPLITKPNSKINSNSGRLALSPAFPNKANISRILCNSSWTGALLLLPKDGAKKF